MKKQGAEGTSTSEEEDEGSGEAGGESRQRGGEQGERGGVRYNSDAGQRRGTVSEAQGDGGAWEGLEDRVRKDLCPVWVILKEQMILEIVF